MAAMLLLPDAGAAQTFDQVGPKAPPQSKPGQIATPSPGDEAKPNGNAPDEDKRILPALKGLRFVSDAARVVKDGVSDAGVDTTEVPSLRDPAILARLEAFVGKPFSFGDLHAINRAVIAFMRSHGRPLVDVAVPAQDVTGGVVQIVVTEFRLEEIRIAHNRWFSKSAIRSGFGAARGQPIDLDRLQRDLDWVNRNPFRRVDAVFARGVATGTTDIQLDVQDRFPLRVYAGFDNSGTPATGRDRWSLGVNFGNLFDRDVQLSYQFMAGDDFLRHIADGKSRFLAHSASVLVPLAWHGLVEVFGSYVRQSPDVGPFFGQVGYSAQISGRYVQLLDGPPWLSQELQAGFDYKTTDNNLAFGGTQVFSASEDVAQFLATYSASAADPWGVTTLGNDLVVSPGGLTAGNTTAAFARSGTSFARAGYVYDTLTLARTTLLPYGAHSTTRLTAQYADGNLLPSEQLGGGGEESVRGYDPRAVNGSEGLLVREELHSPSFRPLGWMFGAHANNGAQIVAFWDYARLRDPHMQPGNPDHFALESVGAGFNWVIGRTIDLRSDYGWQLLKLPGAARRGAQANVAVVLSF